MGGIIGGIIGANGAKKAAKAQLQASREQVASQEEARDIMRGDLAPYREGGTQAYSAMQNMLGLGAAPTIDGEEWSWQTDPGYQFRLDQGQDAIEASRAAKGGLYSGAAMRDLLQHGQDYASNEFGNVFNRLGSVANAGQNAAAMSGNASMQAANGISSALGAQGNAQAAGYIGQANAWTNALGNTLGMFNYQNQMNGSNNVGGSDRFSFGNLVLGNGGWF